MQQEMVVHKEKVIINELYNAASVLEFVAIVFGFFCGNVLVVVLNICINSDCFIELNLKKKKSTPTMQIQYIAAKWGGF